MNLKEKIDSTIMRHDLMRNETHETIEQLEEIADEFAIGFAEWLNINAYKFPTKTTTRELLEIYKKILV